MAFFGLALILLIVYGIDFFDSKIGKKNNEDIERIHKEAYEWIDKNTNDPALARERKAEIDTMVHNTVALKGREYHPPTLKEVTDERERKERRSSENKSKKSFTAKDIEKLKELIDEYEDIKWHYEEHTEEEKHEHLVKSLMKELNLTREEAEIKAIKTKKSIENANKWLEENIRGKEDDIG